MSDFWDFIARKPFGPSVAELPSDQVRVNWFLPPVSRSGGGHINLFRFARGLERRGFRCGIIVTNDGTIDPRLPDDVLRSQVCEWFGEFGSGVHYMDGDVPPAHISIATGWQSAYGVRAFRGSPLKYYFIQDFEPWFYARGSEYGFAEDTYRFGFTGITAGRWLSTLVSSQYGMKAHPVGFSYDRSLYVPTPRRPGPQRVFFYARPETQRRGWELAQLTIKRAHELRPDVEFVLAGGQVPPGSFDFSVFAPGSLPPSELPDLYSQCDCALVLSFTNLSLLPLELMACGVSVVSNRGDNVEWLLNGSVVQLCPPTPDRLAEGIIRILARSPGEQAAARAKSMAFAAATDWEREISKMAQVLSADAARLRVGRPRSGLLPLGSYAAGPGGAG